MGKINKKILITGAAGFLGSHLCEQLINDGHEVICVDNFFTGSKENLSNIIDNNRFEIIRHDITLPLFIEVDETLERRFGKKIKAKGCYIAALITIIISFTIN